MAIAAAALAAGAMGAMSSSSASKKAEKAAKAGTAESGRQFDLAMLEMKKAAEYLESIGIPPIEAQRIALEHAQLDPSAMEDIETDPRLRSAQMDALARVQEMGGAGLTEAERAQQFMITRGAGAQAQARDKAILQSMQERGLGGSGMELAQRLQASQSGAERASMQQAQLAGQSQQRALQAMMQAGQLGGQIRGQEFGEQAQVASASDRIAQFNAMQKAAAQQQQELYNKQLIQKQFENEMAKRQAVASARTGTAQAGMQRAGQIQQAGQAAAAGHLQAGAAKSQLIGSLAGAGLQAYGGYQGAGSTTAASGPDPYAQPAYGIGPTQNADGGIIGTAEYRDDEYAEGGMVPAPMAPYDVTAPNSNGGFDAGGVLSQGYEGGHKYAGGGLPVPDSGMDDMNRYLEGDIVPGNNFEGDRVDAKINSGEMVLNIEQQQRLMELLKGLRDLQGLGGEDIIQGGGQQPSPDVLGSPLSEEAIGSDVQFDNGGMVGDYRHDDDKYSSRKAWEQPRGLHSSLDHERKEEEASNVASKERKARIKAYETLANGGK